MIERCNLEKVNSKPHIPLRTAFASGRVCVTDAKKRNPTQMKPTKKKEMYMANAKILRSVPNATYIPLTRVGGFALGDAKKNALGNANETNTKKKEMYMANAKNLRSVPNATYIPLTRVGGEAKGPNENSFASQWNIGLRKVLSLTCSEQNIQIIENERFLQIFHRKEHFRTRVNAYIIGTLSKIRLCVIIPLNFFKAQPPYYDPNILNESKKKIEYFGVHYRHLASIPRKRVCRILIVQQLSRSETCLPLSPMRFALPTSGLDQPCAVPNFTGIPVVTPQPASSVSSAPSSIFNSLHRV